MKDNFERFMISQAAIIIRGDKFLIMQFGDSGKWGLPGGRIDKGETGKEALRRELKEELGVDKYEYLGVADYDFNYYERRGEIVPKLNLINLVHIDPDQELIISLEHSDSKWITVDEMDGFVYAWTDMERMAKNAFKLHNLLYKSK